MKGIAGYSIQAGDFIMCLWGFQVNFSCSFISFTIFGPSLCQVALFCLNAALNWQRDSTAFW